MHVTRDGRSNQEPLGRRERNKRDKMVRIERAARMLFSKQGFEATTIRQIAEAADIGLGTVFSYATNKNDLLVLIFQDEVGRAVDRAFATVPDKPLLDRVLHVFGAIIAHHRASPGLARVFVKETPFIDDRRHGIRDFMRDLFAGLMGFVDDAKSRGELEPDVPAALLVRNLFAVYFQAMQVWLSGRAPELDTRRLRDALELQLGGLRPTPRRPRATAKSPRASRRANRRSRAGDG
jgi:AcrR family transcriptional regulator